jgi:hypothetical protein
MTFEEAKTKKELLADTYWKDDREYEYLVIPELSSDHDKFLITITRFAREQREITDDLAIKFSSDKKFIVSGFWTDGVDLILDDEIF